MERGQLQVSIGRHKSFTTTAEAR